MKTTTRGSVPAGASLILVTVHGRTTSEQPTIGQSSIARQLFTVVRTISQWQSKFSRVRHWLFMLLRGPLCSALCSFVTSKNKLNGGINCLMIAT